jgi:hypothetical protein
MFDACINQAAGLQCLAPQLAPKLVAVVSHGQQHGELPLLWSLCSTWVDMGLPVMVLDGHAQESEMNPGLVHKLTDPGAGIHEEQVAQAWTVLPAALGFEQLSEPGFNSGMVADLFQNYGVVLLYAGAATLTGLIKGTGLAPLLVVAPLKASSLTAYRALKQLLLDARVRPTVANIALVANATATVSQPTQNLQDCAMTFLGLDIKPITLSALAKADDSHDEINRLALQLLESAVFLERHPLPRTH